MKKLISLLMCVILAMTPVLVAADTGSGPVSGAEAATESGTDTAVGEAEAEPAGAAEPEEATAASEGTDVVVAAPEEAGAAATPEGADVVVAAPEGAEAGAAASEDAETPEPPKNGFFGAIGKAVDYVSEKAGDAGRATKETIAAAGHAISGVAAGITERTGTAVSKMHAVTDRVRHNIVSTAKRVSEATSSFSRDIGEKTASTAEEAMDVIHEAAGTVSEGASEAVNNAVEGASEAVNNAVEGAGEAVDTAVEGVHSVVHAIMQALSVVAFKGAELISVVDEAVAGLDLSNPENYERVRQAVDKAVMAAYDHGIIGKSVSRDAIRIIEELAFASTVYGYQYTHGQITLRQYVIKILRIVLRSELPTAVGILASRLPIPGAGEFAKELTIFLIQTLLGEKYEAGRPLADPTPTPVPAGA